MRIFFLSCLLLFATSAHAELPTDPGLRKSVDFWVDIYSKYTTEQGVVHDAKYVDKVYEVLNLHGRQSSHQIYRAKLHWRAVLLSLHKKEKSQGAQFPQDLTAEELRIFQLFADVHEPDRFLEAAHRKRLRFQLGQKENFLSGYIQSGRYIDQMEKIFAERQLPIELTRLPFIESSFNLRARSKVGASGIWQFMPSTGRLFLRVDSRIDERNDQLTASRAAAQLLKLNYDSLGNWPLAVTAYNHGRKGLMRAVRKLGSNELIDLLGAYRSRTWGFASTNFYVELLAVNEVERNAARYFGEVARLKPFSTYEVKLPDAVSLRQLKHFLRVDWTGVAELNPSLLDDVLSGSRPIPAGYSIRLPLPPATTPEFARRLFMAGYGEIPQIYKLK